MKSIFQRANPAIQELFPKQATVCDTIWEGPRLAVRNGLADVLNRSIFVAEKGRRGLHAR